jgi:hypothetical protein
LAQTAARPFLLAHRIACRFRNNHLGDCHKIFDNACQMNSVGNLSVISLLVLENFGNTIAEVYNIDGF